MKIGFNVGGSLLAAGLVSLLGGCSATRANIPEGPTQLATASYTIVGETSAKECGAYVAGINFGRLFVKKGAQVDSSVPGLGALPFVGDIIGGGSPEQAEATYAALEKVPGATHLVKPRTKTAVTGIALGDIPLFAQRCSEVQAVAVKVGGPAAIAVEKR